MSIGQKMKILQSDKMKQNKRPAMKSMSASLFCRALIRSKVGAKSVGHMFWPWYANHVFASPQSSRHYTAFWAMFSGVLLPEYPCKYPSVWVGERSDIRVGNAALKKGWNSHPPSLETENTEIKNSQWHVELKRCFRVWVKGRFWFLFFCLVNLFTLEQIFAVVKIRHSSLILKEVLLIFTSKPQDGGEES